MLIHLDIPDDLLASIDARADLPRDAWIIHTLERAIEAPSPSHERDVLASLNRWLPTA